jgi:hypothetical protein
VFLFVFRAIGQYVYIQRNTNAPNHQVMWKNHQPTCAALTKYEHVQTQG